jgi:hypothetical protein
MSQSTTTIYGQSGFSGYSGYSGISGKSGYSAWSGVSGYSGPTLPTTWTAPAFNAGDFTASGSMTITVESGDVLNYAYIIFGNTMTVSFSLNNFTIAGTPDTIVYIKIPASKTATKRVDTVCRGKDNGTASFMWAGAAAGATNIGVGFISGANWTASTNNSSILGEIIFEIN